MAKKDLTPKPLRSGANNLVDLNGDGVLDNEDDNNRADDIFVHDTVSATTEIISIDSDGRPALYNNYYPTISDDGRFVAFATPSRLLPEDTNDYNDIYVRDRTRNITILASVGNDGSVANSNSTYPAISGDGNWLAFESTATNLTTDDDNGVQDVFLTNIESLFQLASDGSELPDASAPQHEPLASNDTAGTTANNSGGGLVGALTIFPLMLSLLTASRRRIY